MKLCFPDLGWQLHIWIHIMDRIGIVHKTHSSWRKIKYKFITEGGGHEIMSLIKSLLHWIDNSWARESHFPLMRGTLVNRPHSIAGLMSKSSWVTQAGLGGENKKTPGWVGMKVKAERVDMGGVRGGEDTWSKYIIENSQMLIEKILFKIIFPLTSKRTSIYYFNYVVFKSWIWV